jgi:hypothetical protein
MHATTTAIDTTITHFSFYAAMVHHVMSRNKNKRSIPMWVRGTCAAAATVMVLLLLLLRDIFFLLRRFLDSRSFPRVAVV